MRVLFYYSAYSRYTSSETIKARCLLFSASHIPRISLHFLINSPSLSHSTRDSPCFQKRKTRSVSLPLSFTLQFTSPLPLLKRPLRMSSKDLSSSRRGSGASSISVTITTTSRSSLPAEDIPDHLAQLPSFIDTTSSSIEPSLPSLPSPQALTLSLDPPPPPYQFPPSPSPSSSTTQINPLSFYPFQTLTPVSSSFPSLSSLPPPPPPPSYAEVPQTKAEKYFIYGFLFFPLWILGASRYWFSERPIGFTDEEKEEEDNAGMGEEERERVKESLKSWREEEIVWSLRCLWSLASLSGVGLVLGVLIAGMMGKL